MIKIERILCPTDLTAQSDEALRYAAALACAYHAQLFAIHCVQTPASQMAELLNRAKESLKASVDGHLTAQRCKQIGCETIVLAGDPVEAINHEAARLRIDLIVIRSRHRPHAAALLGSTAESICRTAPCPVLVTHPHEREWVGKFTTGIDPGRILVGYDYSSDSELALLYGQFMVEQFNAELHLLHAVKPSLFPRVQEITGFSLPAEIDLEKEKRRLEKSLPNRVLRSEKLRIVIVQGQPYRGLLEYAKNHEIDLICMGANGFGDHALFGSNVDRVLRQANCPVLIARPLRSHSMNIADGSLVNQ